VTTPLADAPDPLALLARSDKWQLGAGDGIIFAPPYPVWLDAPGFWDEATIYQYAFGPLFTVTILDREGRELTPHARSRRWSPAELSVEYEFHEGLVATEVRTVQAGGVFASEWRFRSAAPTTLHVIAWTAQDAASIDRDSLAWSGAIRFTRSVLDRRRVPLAVNAELTCLAGAASWSASLSQRSAHHPRWSYAPFAEQWQNERLPNTIRFDGLTPDGLWYAAVHRSLAVGAGDASVAFAMRLRPVVADLHTPSDVPVRHRTPAGGSATLGVASRRRWRELFARAPVFRCSDPYLESAYWYRWYGLWLNAIAPGHGNYRHPTMCEGIDFFHQPITYSAQCHVRELRWLNDVVHARGVFRTFFDHQKEDGSLHGRVYVNHLEGTDFYHANWGDALLELDAISPDDAFLSELCPRLARYANWLVRTRDRENSGLFDVVDQYETGQEYMSRYQAVDANADAYGWENRIRLKGVDVTTYAYALFRALERCTDRLGDDLARDRWTALARRTQRAVRETMWDGDAGMFFDVDPRSRARTGVRAAVCFYPYFTDIPTSEHREGFERNLLDPERFWTTFPVPSSSLDDPLFSAIAEWKGKRHVCPWNGRVWPMTNSHVVEALVTQATITESPRLRDAAAQLVRRFVRMMTFDGNPHRPNSFEHYNPFTAAPSAYRGIDDYQHSWVADLILRLVTGIRPYDGGILIDPYPFGVELAAVTGVRARGRTIDVRVENDRYTVTVDGASHRGVLGQPVEIRD
jgi:hypothetical protein